MSGDKTMGTATTTASDTTSSMRGTTNRLYDSAGQPMRGAVQAAQGQADQLATFVREQPLTAALSALIIGYILGKIT